jgi:hypothetical protein
MPHDDVPFSQGTPSNWDAGVQSFQLRRIDTDPASFEIVGPCPRCTGELVKDVTGYVAPALADDRHGEQITVRVVCNCEMHHHGQPDGTTGCGAEGGVELEF